MQRRNFSYLFTDFMELETTVTTDGYNEVLSELRHTTQNQ